MHTEEQQQQQQRGGLGTRLHNVIISTHHDILRLLDIMKYMIVTVQYIDTVELNIVSSNLHDSVTIQVIYKLLLVSYMLIS